MLFRKFIDISLPDCGIKELGSSSSDLQQTEGKLKSPKIINL